MKIEFHYELSGKFPQKNGIDYHVYDYFPSNVERMGQVTLLLTTGTIKRASSALLDPAD